MHSSGNNLYAPIVKNIQQFINEFDQIPAERKRMLRGLALFVKDKINAGENAELIFICTHNSRRSHISQIWAQTAAAYYNVPNVMAYSGGTEATAFNPRAVKALQHAGFGITKITEGTNPVYQVKFAGDAPALNVFSKKYEDGENPQKEFAAVMTCSHADQHCPAVAGASIRISLPFDDPKDFDDTPLEAARYAERVHQIGREILYAFYLNA
jgi:arsenate reductase